MHHIAHVELVGACALTAHVPAAMLSGMQKFRFMTSDLIKRLLRSHRHFRPWQSWYMDHGALEQAPKSQSV